MLRQHFDLQPVEATLYPFKGSSAPTKIAMNYLFVGTQGPKWNPKVHRYSMNAMLPLYRLLAKIVLVTMWPISRHTEMTLERAQFMFALATGVPIDCPRHVIDVIYKAHIDKELNLPFCTLIMALAMKAKVPIRKNEPNLKIVGPISAISDVKFEAILTK